MTRAAFGANLPPMKKLVLGLVAFIVVGGSVAGFEIVSLKREVASLSGTDLWLAGESVTLQHRIEALEDRLNAKPAMFIRE